MKLWQRCVVIALGCTGGQFLDQAVFDHAWLTAIERSYFQALSLLFLWFASRYIWRVET
jgi:hypothetical protein